jgi:hypothetical protein
LKAVASRIFLVNPGDILHFNRYHLNLLRERVSEPVKNIITDKEQNQRNKKSDSKLLPANKASIEETVLIALHDMSHGVEIEKYSEKT